MTGTRVVVGALAVAGLLLTGVGQASAARADGGAAATAKPPAGYVEVGSTSFSAPAGIQTAGYVSCPGRKVPVGGGVGVDFADLSDNINSSYPSGQNWVVDVNNNSLADTTFTVYAVCVNRPKGYQVATTAKDNPSGAQTEVLAQCGGSRVPWGGGFFSTSGNLLVNANSSYPTGDTTHDWNVFENNNSQNDAQVTAYAVCARKPRLYGQSFATGTLQSESEGSATGMCASNGVVTGGGEFTSSPSVYVNLSSTHMLGSNRWISYINNDADAQVPFDAYAVCLGL